MKPLDTSLQNFLGVFYLLAALLNGGFALYYFKKKDALKAFLWFAVASLFLVHTIAYFAHFGWTISPSVTRPINAVMGPVSYTMMSVVGFVLLLVFRKFFVNPQVAFAILNLSLLFSGWAMTNPHFGGKDVMGKADNVPIPLLIYSVGFFTWLGLYRAVQNDERIEKGEVLLEKAEEEKVLVWPDLVYTELICMIVATVVLVMWSVLLKAPLEQPATQRQGPQSLEGAVVLPRLAGDAGLLRSVDGRRGAADVHHHRHDRHAVHRLQPGRGTGTSRSRAASSRSAFIFSASWSCG